MGTIHLNKLIFIMIHIQKCLKSINTRNAIRSKHLFIASTRVHQSIISPSSSSLSSARHFQTSTTHFQRQIDIECKNVTAIIHDPATLPITDSGFCPVLGKNEHLPYFVQRTVSNNLPVYLKVSKGRTRYTTVVKGISGDANQFLKDFQQNFPDAIIELRLSHMEVKGHQVATITKYLLSLGF